MMATKGRTVGRYKGERFKAWAVVFIDLDTAPGVWVSTTEDEEGKYLISSHTRDCDNRKQAEDIAHRENDNLPEKPWRAVPVTVTIKPRRHR